VTFLSQSGSCQDTIEPFAVTVGVPNPVCPPPKSCASFGSFSICWNAVFSCWS